MRAGMAWVRQWGRGRDCSLAAIHMHRGVVRPRSLGSMAHG